MVARSHPYQQDIKPEGAAYWGQPGLQPLPIEDVRIHLSHSQAHGVARLMFAVLLTHADILGSVSAYTDEIAAAAGMSESRARHLLQRLGELGEIKRVRAAAWRYPSAWQIVAVQERAA